MTAVAFPELRGKPAGSPESFKAGMRRMASGVCLVTSAHGEERFGLVATSVCSLSLEPPTLIVCIGQDSPVYEAIALSGVLCVNVMRPGHAHLVEPFSTPERRSERFLTGEWTTLSTGAPVLADALTAFDCRVVESMTYSTHTIFLAVPDEVLLPDPLGDPLVHFNRGFMQLE